MLIKVAALAAKPSTYVLIGVLRFFITSTTYSACSNEPPSL